VDASTVTFVISALKLVGYGLGAIGPGIGIGIACYGCCVATARQPELQGRLFTDFIIGAAMAEALALIGFVLTFIL
jgi:F-type H+-transporting ATPase subunit c